MRVTERDLTGWGWENAKARTKARGRVPWRYYCRRVEVAAVTLEEAIKQARVLYPDLIIKPATVYKWTERGLLPSPDVRSLGGRQGTKAEYSDDWPAQMAVAAHLQDSGFTQRQIAQARTIVLEDVTVDSPELEDLRDVLAGRKQPEDVNKATRKQAEAVRGYAYFVALARAGRRLRPSLGSFSYQRHGYDSKGNPTFSYSISLPGFYWDPRMGAELEKDPMFMDFDQQIRQQRDLIQRKRDKQD